MKRRKSWNNNEDDGWISPNREKRKAKKTRPERKDGETGQCIVII